MELDFILNLIEENGYIGLFLWLWFGIFGVPIPNEVIIMTVGLAASQGVLNPFLTFFVVYMGILAALTTSYLLGRYIGRNLLAFFKKRKRFSHNIEKSLRMMEKYHAFSLSMSYFIPGVRNFIPFLYGFSRLSYKTFAMFAYTGSFVWLIIMFSLGYTFGDHIETIMVYGKEMLIVIIALAIAYVTYKHLRKRKAFRKQVQIRKKSGS